MRIDEVFQLPKTTTNKKSNKAKTAIVATPRSTSLNQAVLRIAATGDLNTIRKFGQQNQAMLTNKQKMLLVRAVQRLQQSESNQSLDAGSGAYSTQQLVAQVRKNAQQLRALEQNPSIQNVLSSDPRNDPEYNHFYAMYGNSTWPLPHPVASKNMEGRFAYARGTSDNASYSLAAGEYLLIISYPRRREYPMSAYATTASGSAGLPATSITWSRQFAQQDKTNVGSVNCTWQENPPTQYLEDPSAIDTAPRYMNVPDSDSQPVTAQVMAWHSNVQVATPYGGQAIVYSLSPGDAEHRIGHNMEQHRYPATTDVLPYEYRGHYRCPYVVSAQTPIDFMTNCGKATLMGGNESKCFSMRAQPDHYWHSIGELKSLTAADDGYVSVQNGFAPRDNFVPMMHYGATLIKNSSSTDALTVMMSCNAVYAVRVKQDDADRTVGLFASKFAREQPEIKESAEMEVKKITPIPTITGSNEAEVQSKVAEHVKGKLNPQLIANVASEFMKKHSPGIESAVTTIGNKTISRVWKTVKKWAPIVGEAAEIAGAIALL